MKGFLKKSRKNAKLIFVAGSTAAVVSFAAATPAKADLASAIADINAAMTALEGIAETGVAISVVPFGISFALRIAGTVLRAGT